MRYASISKVIYYIGEEIGPVLWCRLGLLSIVGVNGEAVNEALNNKCLDGRPELYGVRVFNKHLKGSKFV